jgi:hypothetical protein
MIRRIIRCLAFALILTCTLELAAQKKVLLKESFNYPDGPLPAGWWFEGDSAFIRDGRLYVDSDAGKYKVSTIWFEKEFEGNLSIEFDVTVLASAKRSNNINFFLFYASPDGRSLKETRSERINGRYPLYHDLNGYIFTHLANGNEDTARFRFRYNPGFTLLQEKYTYECRRNVTYHVRIVKSGSRFQYWTDNRLILECIPEPDRIHSKGIIGFRTFDTCLVWDNLKILHTN